MLKIVEVWGVYFEVEFEGTPFRPARTYGPPEDCYPAEGGEAEILAIRLDGNDLMGMLTDKVETLILEDLTQYLCSDVKVDEVACEADREFDRRREEALA